MYNESKTKQNIDMLRLWTARGTVTEFAAE